MGKRVPQYLKEISTSTSGKTEGDFAWEWDPAEHSYEHEDHGRGSWQAKAGNYLGWWDRGKRGVYYFGEHQRPFFPLAPEACYWRAYDWYESTAKQINIAFEDEERIERDRIKAQRENRDLFSEKGMTWKTKMLPIYPVPRIVVPNDIRNIKGIGAWLQGKYASTEFYLTNYNEKARKFNSAVKALFAEHLKEEEIERKNQKIAREDYKYTTIINQLGELRSKIGQLNADIKQLRTNKDKEFSLFKSELTSRIPDVSLNVSKAEHDEDIAQLNETIQGIKKIDISGLAKRGRETNDSIARLQKRVNISSTELNDVSLRLSEEKAKVGKLESQVDASHRRAEKLEVKQEEQEESIVNLRRELQALGGEAREFIDNTKRREQLSKTKAAKKESVVTRIVKKAAFPDLTKRPWLKESVIGRFFQLANQW